MHRLRTFTALERLPDACGDALRGRLVEPVDAQYPAGSRPRADARGSRQGHTRRKSGPQSQRGYDVVASGAGASGTDDDAARLRDRYGLTLREVEVTGLLLRGESNRKIADWLNISEHTARHHTESVLGKLGVRSRAAIPRAVSPLRSSGPFRGA